MRRMAILGAVVYAGFLFNAAQGLWQVGLRVVTHRNLQNVQLHLLIFTLSLGLIWPVAEEQVEEAPIREAA